MSGVRQGCQVSRLGCLFPARQPSRMQLALPAVQGLPLTPPRASIFCCLEDVLGGGTHFFAGFVRCRSAQGLHPWSACPAFGGALHWAHFKFTAATAVRWRNLWDCCSLGEISQLCFRYTCKSALHNQALLFGFWLVWCSMWAAFTTTSPAPCTTHPVSIPPCKHAGLADLIERIPHTPVPEHEPHHEVFV